MTTDQNLREPVGGPVTVPAEPPPARSIDTRSRRLAFSAILLTMLLAALDQSIVATALPRIVGDLGGFNSLSWVVSAYLLASTVTIPLYGKLSDIYGRRLLFVVAISVFLAGSALCGLASSMGQLIAFRALQGLGAGGLVPLAQAAIGDLYSARDRGRYQGYVASMWGIAAVSGPLVGGTLTQAISWRWIFYINLPLGLAAMVVVIRTLSGTGDRKHRIDYAGAVALGASLGAILLACTWAGTTYPIASGEVIGPFAAGLIGLGAFALIERRASEPIIPFALIRNRIVATSLGAFFVVGAVLFAVTIYMPVYLQDVRGDTPTVSGLTMISFMGAWVVSGIVVGRRITRSGRYRVYPVIGASLVTLGLALLILLGKTTGRVEICLLLAISGCGMGMTASPYIVASQNAISASMFGSASAAMALFRAIGGSLAVSVLGALLAGRARSVLTAQLGARAHGIDISGLVSGAGAGATHHSVAVAHALLSGLHAVYLVAAVVSLVGIVCAIVLEERPLGTEVAHR
jgi:EmrB/QacA subfamily drug resistance transporter